MESMRFRRERQVAQQVVLVVDDSPTVRKIVQITLQRENIRVVTAGDGLSALAAVSDTEPDLILLDIVLPRMDGYNICHLVRNNSEYRDLPIIMLSGKDGIFDKMRGRLAGSTEYITKPFDSSELVQAVRRYLDTPAARERTARRESRRVTGMRRGMY
jgi:twitching motility two-component system response regulator PilG